MQRVGRDGRVLKPPGQLVAEQYVGELGLVVSTCPGVDPCALEVVEVDAPLGVGVGGHRYDAGWDALLQPVQQQGGEQERREMINGEGSLQPVGGGVPGIPVPADVIDQHIDPRQGLEYLLGQPSYLCLGGQVGDEHVDLPTAGCADLPGRVLSAASVAAGNRQVCTHHGQAQSGRLTDAS